MTDPGWEPFLVWQGRKARALVADGMAALDRLSYARKDAALSEAIEPIMAALAEAMAHLPKDPDPALSDPDA